MVVGLVSAIVTSELVHLAEATRRLEIRQTVIPTLANFPYLLDRDVETIYTVSLVW